jgi:hypothetical protein
MKYIHEQDAIKKIIIVGERFGWHHRDIDRSAVSICPLDRDGQDVRGQIECVNVSSKER